MTSITFLAGLVACALLLPFGASARDRAPTAAPRAVEIFDPLTIKANVGGPVSDVLVLGSDHLEQRQPPPEDAVLDPLLDRLERYAPTLIAVEAVSGPDCAALLLLYALSPGVNEQYCRNMDAAQAATGMDVATALVAANTMLSVWPVQPSAAQRRRLAALFVAAGDRTSAVVQWLSLPPSERVVGDSVDAALFEILETTSARPNERIAVAARLAVRLGLQRVYPIDDHSADSIQANFGDVGENAVQAVWSRIAASEFGVADARVSATAVTPDGMLAFYRWMNLPASQRAYIANDHAANMADAAPPYYGRRYGMWWEARNLRMVANLRAAMADRPGARVLMVVGASHKPYMDAYLHLMHDVTIVDAATVLR